jgi:hypothetical protein
MVGHCSVWWEMMGWALAAELYINLDFLIMKFSINKIIIIIIKSFPSQRCLISTASQQLCRELHCTVTRHLTFNCVAQCSYHPRHSSSSSR